jgi:hypothetical protein
MVKPLYLILGLVLTTWSVWGMMNPHKDFALGKEIDPAFWGVDNKRKVELNETGVLKQRIGYIFSIILGLAMIIYAL